MSWPEITQAILKVNKAKIDYMRFESRIMDPKFKNRKRKIQKN